MSKVISDFLPVLSIILFIMYVPVKAAINATAMK